jgi:hypothetical protein
MSNPKNVYFLVSDEKMNYVSSEIDTLMSQAMKHPNLFVLPESEFLSTDISVYDDSVVIVYVSVGEESMRKLREASCSRILYTIDESKRDGGLFQTQLDLLTKIDSKTIITVYPSKRNVEFLETLGVRVIQTYLHAPERDKVSEKLVDVLITGQMDHTYYPVRTRISALLVNDKRFCESHKVVYLPHPGFTKEKCKHAYHGEKYFKLLDQTKVGVVCKSFKDRLLQKYSEFGMSWVLPVGNIPDYAPENMKRSMIDVSCLSDEQVPDAVSYVLKHEYDDRVKMYHDSVVEHLESCKCVSKLKQDVIEASC